MTIGASEAEKAAYQRGVRARELMRSRAYLCGDKAAHAEVAEAFRLAYPGTLEAAAIGPGQAPAGGFDRD